MTVTNPIGWHKYIRKPAPHLNILVSLVGFLDPLNHEELTIPILQMRTKEVQ